METSTKGILPQKRIEIIDALRGFSLAGIVIVHMVENYIGAPSPSTFNEAVLQGIGDNIIDGFIGFLLRGKFFALFSFLFGLSFFIQMDNANKRGKYFGGRFLWRLILLLIIGYIHSLFYGGDILTIYAILGIVLIPFYKINNKWVLGLTFLLFLGVGRYIVFYFTQGGNVFPGMDFSPDSQDVKNYFSILKDGTLLDVFSYNGYQGHINKANFQLGVFGRGYITLGFFFLGLLVGRMGFFEKYQIMRKLIKRTWIWSLVLFLVSGGLMGLTFGSMGENVTFDKWIAMLGLTAFDLNNLAMTFILLSVFIIIYKTTRGQKWLSKFAPYGRMALTNYFFQSIIGTFLLFGWGMGYLGELRNIYTFAIAIAIIVLQMVISSWWLKNFRYGPLEWLWRSATFLKIFPMKRNGTH
ncbi:MAG: DUF418 domain-containing protein [Bacteroidota bacterium]